MNYLDVRRFGVQELNAKEMIEVEGGWIQIVIGALLGHFLAQDLDRLGAAYREGQRLADEAYNR